MQTNNNSAMNLKASFDRVILVDENDKEIGTEDKFIAHEKNLRHRAFSIFIYKKVDDKIYLLLQKRSQNKYHSAGLFSNSCCSHPQPKRNIKDDVKIRTFQEIGYLVNEIEKIGTFTYDARLNERFYENEFDHIFISEYNQNCKKSEPNPEEVEFIKWLSIEEIEKFYNQNPDNFTVWFWNVFNLTKKNLKII